MHTHHVGELHQICDKDSLRGVFGDTGDKETIHLDDVHLRLVEHLQTAITGSKIVQSDVYAQALECREMPLVIGAVRDGVTFRYLQDDPLCRYSAASQKPEQERGGRLFLKKSVVDVEEQAAVLALGVECVRRLLKEKLIDLHEDAVGGGPIKHGMDRGKSLRIEAAKKRLVAEDPAGVRVHDRLKSVGHGRAGVSPDVQKLLPLHERHYHVDNCSVLSLDSRKFDTIRLVFVVIFGMLAGFSHADVPKPADVLDSMVLADLPGVTEPVDARAIEIIGEDGLVVGGRDLLVEFGPAFNVRRRVSIDGATVTTIARDIDGRIAFQAFPDNVLRIVDPDSPTVQERSIPTDFRGEVLFVDDGSIVLVNLSLRRAERLVGAVGMPVDLFSSDSSLIDAVARGPGGEIWITDRERGQLEIRAGDGTPIDRLLLPPEVGASPVRAIAVGADGSSVVLLHDRIVRLDPDGGVLDLFDSVAPSGTIPISQISAVAYRAETGELFLLDAGGGRIHRVLLDGEPSGGVVADLARLKEAIAHADSRSALRRLRVRTMATYERNGATSMAERIRADLIYGDPFGVLPEIGGPLTENSTGSRASLLTSIRSTVPPGLERLKSRIDEISRDIGYPGYDLLGRGIVAWELARVLAPTQSDTLGPTLRDRPTATILRHGLARREELPFVLVDLWRAAGLEATILPRSGPEEAYRSAFRSGLPWDQREYLGPLARAAVNIDGECWIALSPDRLGQSFLYAASATPDGFGRTGGETGTTAIYPIPSSGAREELYALQAGDIPVVDPPPAETFREQVERSLSRVENAVRDPILAAARDRVESTSGRARMVALNDLALAELSAGVPTRAALTRAGTIWRGLRELDSDWEPAEQNLELLDRLAEGRIELFSLPWVR